MAELKRRETMWATMEPDCYGGPTCDQIEPRWRCFAEGDKDSDTNRGPIELSPHTFPPGTQVTVSEPICPSCGDLRGFTGGGPRPTYKATCDCGFDWEMWTVNEYS